MFVSSVTYEAEIGRPWLEGSLGKNLVRPVSKNKLGVVMYSCNPSYSGDGGRRIVV
jgi:hypothetical protein